MAPLRGEPGRRAAPRPAGPGPGPGFPAITLIRFTKSTDRAITPAASAWAAGSPRRIGTALAALAGKPGEPRPAEPTGTGRVAMIKHRLRTLSLVLVAMAFSPVPGKAETVLRVAMTAGDIPDWTGQPDQGFEGFRFVGWSLYDALVMWDLSRSDTEAPLTPGLATKWSVDPGDKKKWIFELRRDVKFHDGCPWNADAAIWN